MNIQSNGRNGGGESPVELECQFIMRLPIEPANALREMLRSGMSSLKDRFSIRLENDVRYGEVKVDNWHLHAKVVDLPTIVESLKTIDNKSFYKTADICQMMICKEEDDQTTTDEESPSKHKKKDPNKVDKKFLWPHGITPPLKNVRKRRFRKTLKKKYVEAPEIEKEVEVKRLLRGDLDAVNVKFEVLNEEDEKKPIGLGSSINPGGIVIKEEPQMADTPDMSLSNTQQSVDVAEHDIFGEAVSDSDEEETHINIMEMEDNSRLSADDSRISDSISMQGTSDMKTMERSRGLVTQFTKEMFSPSSIKVETHDDSFDYSMFKREETSPTHMTADEIRARLEDLSREIADLRVKRQQHESELSRIENFTLKQRFQDILDNLIQTLLEKEQEFQGLQDILQYHQVG